MPNIRTMMGTPGIPLNWDIYTLRELEYARQDAAGRLLDTTDRYIALMSGNHRLIQNGLRMSLEYSMAAVQADTLWSQMLDQEEFYRVIAAECGKRYRAGVQSG